MESLPTPVLDDHLHLHPEGQGADAATDFANAGGTHLLVVNRPSWHFVDAVTDETAFRTTFEETLSVVRAADAVLPGRAWPVFGVHPALLTRLVDEGGYDIGAATALMKTGLDIAAEYVADTEAVALKSGRPHYDVSEAVWSASNELIRHAAALAADLGCALQLHTEGTDDLREVADWAGDAGLESHRVVKHFATGPVAGVTPSVIARSDAIAVARSMDGPVLFETDFLDDPDRPGAVLGPKLVPRRSRELAEEGHEDVLTRAHVETPAMVYGIDTETTLSE